MSGGDSSIGNRTFQNFARSQNRGILNVYMLRAFEALDSFVLALSRIVCRMIAGPSTGG